MRFSHLDQVTYGLSVPNKLTISTEPYIGMTNQQVIDAILVENYRIPCPNNMPKKIYEIETLCWSDAPVDRPSFLGTFDFILTVLFLQLFADLAKMFENLRNSEDRPQIVS